MPLVFTWKFSPAWSLSAPLRAQPCMGRLVILHVQVRRFKCLNPQCSRTTFVEPIGALAPAKQRRTVGFSGASCAIAQALGGSAAARLSAKLGMPTSRDTLLRALRRLGSEVTMAPPVVVGIDDWAITRGHRYGTIMVDLETRRPIEVLDGRESTSVAEWLQRHPSIRVVARDRRAAVGASHRQVTRGSSARRRKPAIADSVCSRRSSISADGLAETEQRAPRRAFATL